MRALVTGSSGTVGTALVARLRASGAVIAGWDRTRVSPGDPDGIAGELDRVEPSAVFHLALGAESWAAQLAAWCRRARVPFVFTSTAMVFDASVDGPHGPGDVRTARDPYGQYKMRCEDRVLDANERSIVARIGWQIGSARGGNQMIEALCAAMERDGVIRASERWIPATSFLDDTAEALERLAREDESGIVHIDGNAESAWSYPEIVRALAAVHAPTWKIEITRDYAHDQRLTDPRARIRSIADRLDDTRPRRAP